MILFVNKENLCPCGGIYEWLRAAGRDGDCGGGDYYCNKCGRKKPTE